MSRRARTLATVLALSLALPGTEAARGASGPAAPTRVTAGSETSAPTFRATISRVDRATRRRMVGSSWRPGCPVPIRKLRAIRMNRWGFDGEVGWGRMVVHRRWARAVVRVFEALFDAGYPIRRMRLVDAYGADDLRSMKANNTSAFNCRRVAGTTRWSQHAYGRAIDLNPVQNPYVRHDGTVLPRRGTRFADRSVRHPALIREGDAVVRAFDEIGWGWGGRWSSSVDYQHFSSNGR